MTFLPVSHYVNGLALSAAYYFISHLAKIKLAGGLTGAVIKRYLAFASIIILLIFLTGRWI
jgi:hypothetical protein